MIITDDMVNVARSSWLERASDYTMLDVSIRAALEAALAAIPLDEVTVERCAEAALKLADMTDCEKMSAMDWSTGAHECALEVRGMSCLCQERIEHSENIAAAIRALPVAPERPMPTLESVARAICCPDGCEFKGGLTFLANCCSDGCADEATAVLALFGKGGA